MPRVTQYSPHNLTVMAWSRMSESQRREALSKSPKEEFEPEPGELRVKMKDPVTVEKLRRDMRKKSGPIVAVTIGHDGKEQMFCDQQLLDAVLAEYPDVQYRMVSSA